MMTAYDIGYGAYLWLDESELDKVVAGMPEGGEEFKRGYWQADSDMLQLKDDMEKMQFDQ